MARLPGYALQVRGRVTEVCRQGLLPWRQTGRHPCRPPCGLFPPPARRAI